MIRIPRYPLIHIVLLLGVGVKLLGHDHSSAHIATEDYQTPREPLIVGFGAWTYQLVPGWAEQNGAALKLGHCHAILEDAYGRILLLNASEDHCMVVLDPKGIVLDVWGTFAPNAHGLEIVDENGVEYLFITDNGKNGKVFKTTMDGYVLKTISCPMESGLYESPDEFRPSKTMHLPNGDFFVIDGYGKDYVHRYSANGTYLNSFGGNLGQGEARLEHWGPHGGAIDFSNKAGPVVILALSDKNKLKRFSLDGSWLETILLPGSNPRDIVFHRGHMVIPHLGDNWPEDKNAAGYLSILDSEFRVVANLGGEPPHYDPQGNLNRMEHSSHLFHHPHGLCFDQDGNLYVAQFASNGTWPLKFIPISKN